MNRYKVGATVVLSLTVTDPDTAQLVDPDTVTATVRRPDGMTSAPTVSHPSVGVYRVSVVADAEGPWRYRFVGTGAYAGVAEGAFIIDHSEFD